MSDEWIDTGGHAWERETNIMGQTLLSMRCTRCNRQWLPHETLKQIGRCLVLGSLPAEGEQT